MAPLASGLLAMQLAIYLHYLRGADFPEEIDLTKESAGIRAISHGFPLIARDDVTVEKASFLYDALYASLQADLRRT